MNRYTPLFERLVHSSIWGEPDHVRIVWVTMLALQDRDHVVRYTAYALGRIANKSEGEVMDALGVLSSPDRRRVEKQEYDGRRIERVEDGWRILNGAKYQDEMIKANRRDYKAEWQQENRRRKRSGRAAVEAARREGAGEAVKDGMAEAEAEISGKAEHVQLPSP